MLVAFARIKTRGQCYFAAGKKGRTILVRCDVGKIGWKAASTFPSICSGGDSCAARYWLCNRRKPATKFGGKFLQQSGTYSTCSERSFDQTLCSLHVSFERGLRNCSATCWSILGCRELKCFLRDLWWKIYERRYMVLVLRFRLRERPANSRETNFEQLCL